MNAVKSVLALLGISAGMGAGRSADAAHRRHGCYNIGKDRTLFCEVIMNISQVVVQGNLKPDGTLELNETPNLPAGPVEVLIRSQPAPSEKTESWWEFLKRTHAEMVAQGYKFRTKEEIDADREHRRSLDELRRQSMDRRGSTE